MPWELVEMGKKALTPYNRPANLPVSLPLLHFSCYVELFPYP